MNGSTLKAQGEHHPAALSILVMEHHSVLAGCLRAYLEMLGHTVEVAATLRTTRELLREHNFDVLISDVYLPEATCFAFLENTELRLPPFIVTMSGFPLEPQAVRQHGLVRHHFFKPFNPDDLSALLQEFASERALTKFHQAGSGW